jgi:hypothetical protein
MLHIDGKKVEHKVRSTQCNRMLQFNIIDQNINFCGICHPITVHLYYNKLQSLLYMRIKN